MEDILKDINEQTEDFMKELDKRDLHIKYLNSYETDILDLVLQLTKETKTPIL